MTRKPPPPPAPLAAPLNWKPGKPLPAPTALLDEELPTGKPALPVAEPAVVERDLTPAAAVCQELTTGEPSIAVEKPEVAQREQHLVQRAWFSSDGQLVIEAGEHEFVFDRLEARQFVRTVRELGEAWA